MSTVDRPKKRMGRPPVDSEEVKVRMERPVLDALDAMVAGEGLKGRPEAVRRLVKRALLVSLD